MSENYSSDNSGNRCPPHPDISDPVLGSGQNVSAAAVNTNYSDVVVEGGKMYAITCIKGAHIFGVDYSADLSGTDTASNVIWACGEGHTIVIRIPMGYTLLYFQTPDASRRFILRQLAK